MKRLAAILALAVVAIQWPLWFGHGGWLRVGDLQHQLEAQRTANADLEARNASLGAELRSLQQGTEAIEEHARQDLHLMRGDEVFFQRLSSSNAPADVGTP